MLFRRITKTISIFYTLLCIGVFSSPQADWACFHGPERNNKSAETGLLKSWPEKGPAMRWSVSDLGEGYSSVSFAGGYFYTAGNKNKKTYVYAYHLNGKPAWEKQVGEAWETTRSWARAYSGSRSTPTIDGGNLYFLSDAGHLVALDAATGKQIWAMDLKEKFGGELPEYGYAESVLIEGDRLFCSAAGDKAFVICLNKKTGAVIWSNTDIKGNVGFSSHILATSGGYRQLIGLSSEQLYGVDSKTGALLWTVPFNNSRDNNCTDAIFHNDHVFASTGYGKGSMLVKLSASGKKVAAKTVYSTELMDNHHGGVIFHQGHVYGSGSNAAGWFCLDLMTGKQKGNSRGKGSLTFADGMLYCRDEKGTMSLIKATPQTHTVSGSF